MTCAKILLIAASLLGGAAVTIGAIGAHLVKPHLDVQAAASYDTAVLYLFLHVLAALSVAIILKLVSQHVLFKLAGFGFLLGAVLFSGAILLRVIYDVNLSLPLAPVGGLILIVAWLTMSMAALIV